MTEHFDEWFDFPELVDNVQELYEIGLYEEAIALLDKYKGIYHDEWEIYFLYSRYYSEKNEHKKAMECLHKGLSIDKTNPDLLLGLFFTHAMMHNPSKGGRYLIRAAKYHPSSEPILTSLIWYYAEINEPDNALAIFERLTSEGTLNSETYRNGGIAHQRAGDYDLAEECFKTALQLNPQYEEVIDILADQYLFLEKPEKAIELYRNLLKQSPRNLRVLSRLVFCNIQADQNDQASSIAKDIIRIYPNSPVGYVDLAYVFINTDNFEGALEYTDKALDISPLDAEALRLKGLVYSEKKESDIADASFESAISLEPDNIEIIRDYYTHLRDMGQFEKMEQWINTAIKQNHPDCLDEYWFLADFYRDQGQNLKSFHFLHKAYKGMPNEKELIPPMAEILIEQNHIGFSFPILLKYVEKSGWNEIMNEFEHHKQLRDKWSREGLHFLRFWSRRSIDYRTFIFNSYLRKFLIFFSGLIIVMLLLPVWMLSGISGLLIFVAAFGVSFGIVRLYNRFAPKPIALFSKNQSVLT